MHRAAYICAYVPEVKPFIAGNVMRSTVFLAVLLAALSGCSTLPPMATTNPATAPGQNTEVFVKQNHAAIIADIEAGGGATLTQVYDMMGVNAASRDIATLRLQSELPLYRTSPAALLIALRLHGG